MEKAALAVIILTYNEENNIEACIKSAEFADEILVVDCGSSDRTCELAVLLGAKVLTQPMGTGGFAGQRNFALDNTMAQWVLYLDADERILPELAAEVKEVVEKNEPCGYKIKRLNIMFGKQMQHGGHRPDYVTRLYPRTAVSWDGVVHESPQLSVPVKKMKYAMQHYTYTDWNKYFTKFNQYTSLMADKMRSRGKKAGLLDLTLRPVYAFFRFYILQAGFLDGTFGFVFAVLHAYYTFVKYLKLKYS